MCFTIHGHEEVAAMKDNMGRMPKTMKGMVKEQLRSMEALMKLHAAGMKKTGYLYECKLGRDARTMQNGDITKYFYSPEDMSKYFKSSLGRKMLAVANIN